MCRCQEVYQADTGSYSSRTAASSSSSAVGKSGFPLLLLWWLSFKLLLIIVLGLEMEHIDKNLGLELKGKGMAPGDRQPHRLTLTP